jgi:hypothetical protein
MEQKFPQRSPGQVVFAIISVVATLVGGLLLLGWRLSTNVAHLHAVPSGAPTVFMWIIASGIVLFNLWHVYAIGFGEGAKQQKAGKVAWK